MVYVQPRKLFFSAGWWSRPSLQNAGNDDRMVSARRGDVAGAFKAKIAFLS
jgi:hypothetical protein